MDRQPGKSSIVIVTYNSMATLDRCLSGVLNTTDDSIEITVVDNGSTDGTAALLEECAAYAPRVNVICIPDTLGYSAAANIGVRAAQREYVVLLNPDTVVRPGCSSSQEVGT